VMQKPTPQKKLLMVLIHPSACCRLFTLNQPKGLRGE
jgi:hypothetical protein